MLSSTNGIVINPNTLSLSDSTLIQLILQSGSQMRQYAIPIIVVNAITFGTVPFNAHQISLSLTGTTTFTAKATGDSSVNNGYVSYAWLFMVSIIIKRLYIIIIYR